MLVVGARVEIQCSLQRGGIVYRQAHCLQDRSASIEREVIQLATMIVIGFA
jgi:hypothetical protein